MGARIVGIGSAIPSVLVTNKDLEKRVDTTDEWIFTRTGIRERRIVPDDVQASDLAAEAGRKALEMAGVKPEEIDLLICATATPETPFPSTACWAQPKLGLRHIPAFDLSAACSGFLYSMNLADGLLAGGKAKKILLIGVEILSRVTNWDDRTTCVLFGDGAGAAVIVPGGPGEGILGMTWGADGSLGNLLLQPAGGTRIPASAESVEKHLHTVHMAGNEVYKNAVRAMQQSVSEVLEQTGVKSEEIDLLVPHQANLRIIQATADRAGVPMERVYVSIHRYGNNSAASIPIALADAMAEGRLKAGDTVMAAAFGAGFTWGATLMKWL